MVIIGNYCKLDIKDFNSDQRELITNLREIIPEGLSNFGQIQEIYFFLQKILEDYFSIFYYKKIYVFDKQADNIIQKIRETNSDLSKYLPHFRKGSLRQLNIEYDPDKILLQSCLSKIFSIGMMKRQFTVSSNGEIYFVAHKKDIQKYGKIQIWKGFEFSIQHYENTEFHIVIDPKRRFYSVDNLKDEYVSHKEIIFDNKQFRIICPVTSCEFYAPGFPVCRLSSPSKIITDLKLNSETAKEGFDLIEHYKDSKKCLSGELPGNLTLEIPTIDVTLFSQSHPYKYPMDLIRRSPISNEIPIDERSGVMKLIQPKSNIRYIETQDYHNMLSSCTVNGFDRGLNLSPLTKITRSNDILSLRDKFIQFYTVTSKNPTFLLRDAPYDYKIRNFDNLTILIKSDDSDLSDNYAKFIKEGYERFQGIEKLFKVKVNFSEKMHDDKNYDVILEILNEDSGIDENDKFDSVLKIPIVYAHKSSYQSLLRNKIALGNYFQNIAFKLYNTKSAGIWRLSANLEKSFIGFSIAKKQNFHFLYFTVLNEFGVFIKYKILRIENSNWENEELVNFLKNNILQNTDIHMNGNIPNSLKNKIIEITSGLPHSINIVNISNTNYRLYFRNDRNIIVGSRRGICVKISNRYAILRSSKIFQREYQTPQTLFIELVEGDSIEFDQILDDVFSLTKIFTGYLFGLTKFPATIHILSKLMSSNYNSEAPTDKLWFL